MEKILTIFKNAEDLSLKLKSFSTPSISLELLSSDYLYVGFEKFFRTFFVGFDVLNTSPASMSYEYFDGSVWKPLVVLDETYNFSKSGFINFAPPVDWQKTSVNSTELFYLRIKSDVDFSAGTKLQGLNILFACDADLEGIRSDIVTKYNKGKPWFTKHEEARKQIIQRIRNAGHKLVNYDVTNSTLYFGNTKSIYLDDVSEFDILKPSELKEAAKHLAIALIYLNELTDANDDKFERMGKHYMALYNEFMNLFILKIDTNNNGVEDEAEDIGDTGINLKWQ
jgi:hypothetical protein